MQLRLFILSVAFLLPLPASPYGLFSIDPDLADLPENLPALRCFPAWEQLQPAADELDFSAADALVEAAKENKTQIHGILHGVPSEHLTFSEGTDAKFPINDTRAWGNFVGKTIARYPGITHWDILDSYNTASAQSDSPLHYVELLTIVQREVKIANPEAKIGFSLAGFDLEFLDEALRSGAGRYFDYISLAPYVYNSGSAEHFATLLPTLRRLLAEYDISANLPVFVTLTGENEDLAIAAPLGFSLGFEGVFLGIDPAALAEIPEKLSEPVPPTRDFSKEETISLQFGKEDQSAGIIQIDPANTLWDETVGAKRLPVSATPPVATTSFLAAPSFVGPETRELEISFEARRIPDADDNTNPTGFSLIYESVHGARPGDIFWPVPGDNEWHTKTWKVTDAKFEGKYGWNFRIDASGAGNDLLIRKITIKK